MKILLIIIIIIVLYMFFRYRKNEYECTLGLVKSNLSVYYRAVSLGLSYENSLNIMIESRFMNIPLYTPKDSLHYIEQLKNIVLSNKNHVDKKNIVIKILTRMYQIENPNLPDKMRTNHINKIIRAIEKYWNFEKKPSSSPISSDKQQIESNHKDSNMDYLQIGIEAIRYFFQLNSKNLSESDIKLLIDDLDTNLDSIPDIDNILNCPSFDSLFFNDNDNLKKFAGIIFIGIFRASTDKHYFLPIGLVKTYFGKSIVDNYQKNSSDEFIEFTKTFWTFNILLLKLQDNHPNKLITKLFQWLILNVSSIFFPTPGPIKISAEIRKQAQKDILNMVNYSASIESFINGNPILENELEQQLLGKNDLVQNIMSDERKISIATKILCSKIFDIIYSSEELHVELSAQDTVLFLAYSYCLCLFAKVGFTDDLRLLEKFHKSESIQTYLLNWLNMILSRGKEIEFYDSGLDKISKSMIDKFPDIFQVYLDGVKEFLALTEEKMGIAKIQHEFQLMAAASTVTRDFRIILDKDYGVDKKAFEGINVTILDACINAAFEIAGLEKLPND